MNFKEREKLLHLAESTALLAGECLKNRRDEWRTLKSASGHDVKIRADLESEALILECLDKSAVPVFSEEAGAVAAGGNRQIEGDETGLLWIVDPLDGSLNYHQGVPLSCVSIALYDKEHPVLGVVYDFNHGDLFSGLVGRGAWLNHKPIKPSQVNELSKAVLCTGFPVNTDFSGSGLSRFIGGIQHFRKVRLLGSAALSLCYVACGRVDAYREENIMYWDVAAGLALVHSAGGSVEVERVSHMGSPVDVTATNGLFKINGMENSKRKRCCVIGEIQKDVLP